jgi:hypothetical protein
MNFTEEIRALYGQYEQNIKTIRNDSTIELFTYILRSPNNQVQPSSVSQIQIGKFYIIKYDYNGNKLWCPILTIPPVPNKNEIGVLERQLKIVGQKKIIYAVNFDYLPLMYKIALIDSLIDNNIDKYEKNSDKITIGGNVKEEFNFNVKWIYNFLKNSNNKNYAITAYDITKIVNVYEISSTILQRFVFLDTYYINNRMMYDTLSKITNENLRGEFSDKIKMYEEIFKMYEKDVEQFYKSLRSFEKNLKLTENI